MRRKLRTQKIKWNEETVNKLVNHFKLKTSQDLFYRVATGTITNGMIKSFASRYHNALISFFTSKLQRNTKPAEGTYADNELSTKLDLLVFGDEEERLDYALSKECCKADSWR